MSAINSKKPDLDSGLGSPETTESLIHSVNKIEDLPVTKDSVNEKKSEDNMKIEKITPNDKTIATVSKQISEDQDDDEDIDETLAERLWGLTEMFPESLQYATSSITNHTISLIKGTYQLSRQLVWIGVSTSILLFAPVMFEVERYNVEEMVKQDRNRLVLGPGSAMSGSPVGPGLPPIPTR